MLFFQPGNRKSDEPRFFRSKEVEMARRRIEDYLRLEDDRRAQTDPPTVWKMAIPQEVVATLAKRSKDRCAFCERSDIALYPYRFRPPGYATPDLPKMGKASYLWLTFNWDNFFPICAECRPLNKNFFPVLGERAGWNGSMRSPALDGNETAGLHYPGRLRLKPAQFASIRIDGTLLPDSAASIATVAHFNLNRSSLVADRAEALEGLAGALQAVVIRGNYGAFLDRMLETAFDGEFGGAKFLLSHRILRECAERSEEVLPTPGSRSGLRKAYTMLGRRLLAPHLEDVLNALQDEKSTAESAVQSTEPPSGRRVEILTDPIKRVELCYYKSLEDIAFDLPEKLRQSNALHLATSTIPPEAPCLMILGENATGKSSVLEAVALTCLTQDRVDALELNVPSLTLNPEYMGAPGRAPQRKSDISVEFHSKPEAIKRTCHIDGVDRIIDVEADEGPVPLLFAYGAHRLFGKDQRDGWQRHIDTLFDNDRSLSNPEIWLRELWDEPGRSQLNEVVSALRHIIQIDGEFEAIEFNDTSDDAVCMLRMKRGRPGSAEQREIVQPLKIVSSGYRAIFALVCDILRGIFDAMPDAEPHDVRMSPAIVLIDEIESHLHPRWKLNIMTGLRRALPRATFIVTSHDPLCIRGMYNGEVVALNRYENESGDGLDLPERVERLSEFDQVETMTVEQLLTSDLFQLVSTDDEKLDRELAGVADILTRQKAGQTLTTIERDTLDYFNDKIAEGLPIGGDTVTELVQEAVAEYLAERRTGNAGRSAKTRKAAKKAIKGFLQGLAK